jgi:predicted negative regulator of RcsB-dependent stress response
MSVYMTEEEQLDNIKKWWQRYGNLVTIIGSLILLAMAGYKYMNWHEAKVTHQASVTYERMMVAFSNQNIKEVRGFANELINSYGRTVYADAAHLTLAKIFINKEKLDKAMDELQAVATNSKMPALKQIATIRVARILATKQSWTDALKQLTTVVDTAYLPVINELKGDIYTATGQYQEAMASYRQALEQDKTNGMGNLYLEMKTNELAVKAQPSTSKQKQTAEV